MPQPTILRIDSSLQHSDSVTRRLGTRIEQALLARHPGARVLHRDLRPGAAAPAPIDADWVAANLTGPGERSPAQRARLAESDALIDELRSASAVILGVPLYNFSIPSPLKAWIDLVCRARETFRYTNQGPVGLLADRPVYIALASGGVPLGSGADFASGYLRQVLAFLGIRDVHILAADQINLDAAAAEVRASQALERLFPSQAA